MRREIEVDEDTNRLLTELASDCEDNSSLALADLLHARNGLEEFAEQSESAQEMALRDMRDQSRRISGKIGRLPGTTSRRAMGCEDPIL